MIPTLQIGFTPRAEAVLAKWQQMPAIILVAIARGIQEQNQYTVGHIQQKYLSFPKSSPPVPAGLRVQSNRLRGSIRATEPEISGQTVTTSIGTNVKYAALHEFGRSFSRTTQIGPHLVRLRTDKAGNLIRQGANGKLAIFAKNTHKLAKTVAYAGGKTFTVTYPARRPISQGIADKVDDYKRRVSKRIVEAAS